MTTRSLCTAAFLAALSLQGCADGESGNTTGDSTSSSSTPTTGTATMTFSVSNGARQSPALVDPLKGSVYGALYRQEDVTVTGPIDGAMEIASVEVADVDLTTADVSSASWQSEPIEAGSYVFLGFYDVDGNGADSREPDSGDPVTLPSVNKFDVTAGEETTLTASFDLVYN